MTDVTETTVEETPEAAVEKVDLPVGNDVEPTMIEPDLRFKEELAEFGASTFKKCYQCATCSVTCALSPEEAPFPRKEMIWSQWGLKDKLVRDPDIWGCYYCGDCSAKCPRGADPGETMMSLRRYATAAFDWTGISRRLYTSRIMEIGAVVAMALLVVLLFAISGAFGRMDTGHVSVETFIPHHLVHYADWIMAAVLTFFLLTNSLRMVIFLLDGQKVPLSVFISEAKVFLINAATQKRWRDCEGGATRFRWLKHFIMVTGYGTMFAMVMFFLSSFQVDTSEFTPISIIGYYCTFAILYFSGDSLWGRLKKKEEMHKHSHDSDWMFLILLSMTALTGILMHFFRLADLAKPTYIMYVIHLCFVAPMLIIEVPFMKWAHLMYRPLGLYMKAVKEKAREMESA